MIWFQETISSLAENLLNVLPSEFALCGFSMGGYVAFEILRQAPDRVSHLVLINTTHRLDVPEIRQRRKDFIALAEKGKFQGVTPQLIPMLLAQKNVQNHDIRHIIFDMAKQIGREGFIRQEKAILGRQEALSLLPNIQKPVLIIGGQEDKVILPEHLTEMHRLIPGSCLFLLENVGHIAPLEAPQQVHALLESWFHNTHFDFMASQGSN